MRNQKTQQGFIVIQVILIIVVCSIILGSLMLNKVMNSNNGSADRVHSAATLIKSNLIYLIANPQAWQNTINDPANTSVNCLSNPALPCQVNQELPFYLNDASNVGNTFNAYAGSKGTGYWGFGLNGISCPGFDTNNPSGNCPFAYKLTWVAICPTGLITCPGGASAHPQIIGTLLYASSNPIVFNPAPYNFSVVK